MSQVSPSTPGVFLPSFAVTRSTVRTDTLRAYEQELQGFHLAPLAYFLSLHDTRLKTTW